MEGGPRADPLRGCHPRREKAVERYSLLAADELRLGKVGLVHRLGMAMWDHG